MVFEPFTRSQQHGGMVAGELVLGLAAALLLAGVALVLGVRGRRHWLALVGGAAFAFVLVPFLKYPPLPPGAEPSLSIGERQAAYGVLVVAALAGAGAVAYMWSRLRPLALPALLAPPALAFALLPTVHVVHGPSSGLLTEFRLASLGNQLVFWGVLALVGARLLRSR